MSETVVIVRVLRGRVVKGAEGSRYYGHAEFPVSEEEAARLVRRGDVEIVRRRVVKARAAKARAAA
jgi:hypothetical protein